MYKILFICHGNICRSPMAEYVMKYMLKGAGIENVYVDSAAVSGEEIVNGVGNPIYPDAQRQLIAHKIPFDKHRARRITKEDCETFDLIVCMDSSNIRYLRSFFQDTTNKDVRLLRDFSDKRGNIDDPWYTGRFDIAYNEISKGCEGILKAIRSNGNDV